MNLNPNERMFKHLLNFYWIFTKLVTNKITPTRIRNILLTQQIQHWPPWIKWFQSCCYAKYFSCVSLLIPWCWWKSVSHFRVIIWISWKWCKKKNPHAAYKSNHFIPVWSSKHALKSYQTPFRLFNVAKASLAYHKPNRWSIVHNSPLCP